MNDQWAKGHVRLASAYIALGEHSNDACNALQRALQLDPGNSAARDMLVRELRRDQHAAAASRQQASAPPQEQDDQQYSTGTQQQQQQPPPPQDQDYMPNIDDSVTLQDRLTFYYHRCKIWYYAQSNDVQTAIKVFFAILLLYIAFGGRFGLESMGGSRQQRGNYEAGNVYDQYYGRDSMSSSSSSPGGETYNGGRNAASSSPPPGGQNSYDDRDYARRQSTYDDYNSRDTRSYDRNYRYGSDDRHSNSYRSRGGSHYDDDYYHRSSPGYGGSSFSFFDGGLPSIAMILGIAYLLHRNGVNPFNALFLFNMMRGGGRRRHYRGGGMYGGMGGMGGFGGMRYGMGRPPRRRW